jgi:rhodanese-related sulfurtransferase
MKEITVTDLKQKLDNKENIQLIDVREDYEYENANIGGEFIPMGTIMSAIDRIAKDKEVIIMCRSGRRSASVIDLLEKNHGFTNLYNLQGGILAYADQIDPSLDVE